MEAGIAGSGSPRAKSFLNVGVKFIPGETQIPNRPYGIGAIFHRGYISNPVDQGSGHFEWVDDKSISNDGPFKSVGGNVSDQVKLMDRTTKDPNFIEFRLIV